MSTDVWFVQIELDGTPVQDPERYNKARTEYWDYDYSVGPTAGGRTLLTFLRNDNRAMTGDEGGTTVSVARQIGQILGVNPGTVSRMEWTRLDRMQEENPMPDLITGAEVGQILGVSRQRAWKLAETDARFPAPKMRPSTGPLYDRKEVEAYALQRTTMPKGSATR